MSILDRTELKSRKIALDSLREAIRLRTANCYAAMSFANALGGMRTDAWTLCHNHTLKELLAEAEAQQLDLDELKSAIDDIPVKQTLYYRRAAEIAATTP
jgi:hypothetical protein